MLHKRKDEADRIDIDKKYLITKEKILRNKMKILFLACYHKKFANYEKRQTERETEIEKD